MKLSYLIVITMVSQMVGLGAFEGFVCMFGVAFFDKLLGRKRIVAVVAALTLWSMLDEAVPWSVHMMQTTVHTLLAPPTSIEFAVYAFMAVLLLAGTFVGLFIMNFLELYLIKYLVKRWRLKERCGNIHV